MTDKKKKSVTFRPPLAERILAFLGTIIFFGLSALMIYIFIRTTFPGLLGFTSNCVKFQPDYTECMNTRVMVIIGTAFFSVFFIFMTNGAYKSINDFFIKFDEDGLSWRAIGTRGSRSWDEVVSIQNVDFCNLDFCNLGIKFNKPVESVYVDEFHHMLKGFDLNSCNTEVLKTFVPLFQFTTYQQFSKNKHEQNSIWLTMKEYADRDIPVELK